jgi:CRISPR-associated protein Cmr1
VRVRYPKKRQADVEAALWGWANFGGIGSRTRRGCGALFCPAFAPVNSSETTGWVQQRLFSYLEIESEKYDSDLRPWASIAYPPMVDRGHSGSPVEAWKGVIRLLASYRQLPPVGRRGTPNQPRTYSRSNWPEADSLRAITGDGIPEHMDSITTTQAFPRAELGLPYIIKFRSRTGDGRDSVNDCSVLPLDSSRVASPLILRPLAFGPQGSAAVPAIFLISPYALNGVKIQFRRSSKELRGSHYVTDPRLSLYMNSPLGPATDPRSPSGSAVEAFLAFAQEKGFRF